MLSCCTRTSWSRRGKEKYGMRRPKERVRELGNRPARKIASGILADLRVFTGGQEQPVHHQVRSEILYPLRHFHWITKGTIATSTTVSASSPAPSSCPVCIVRTGTVARILRYRLLDEFLLYLFIGFSRD